MTLLGDMVKARREHLGLGLRAAADKMARGDMFQAVDDILDRARINADDTVFAEKSVPEDQYDAIALASVEGILCGRDSDLVTSYSKSRPAAVRKWFERRGVRY